MGFQDLKLKDEYRVPRDNIIEDFYNEVLKNSISYDRSVGYFTSDSLVELSYGICELVKNGGKIRLIVSPNLTEQDYEAISKGFEDRNKIIENNLLSKLYKYEDYFKKERMNIIAELIANDILDLKIAFSKSANGFGLFHEKIGIMKDLDDNGIAFTGSMNESKSAMSANYESIDVFKSWEEPKRVDNKVKAFELLWKDMDTSAKIFEFPDAVKKKLITYKFKEPNYNIDEEEKHILEEVYEKTINKIPHIPKDVQMRHYQIEAINNWKNNHFRGIFDMATGTGKTFTGISAIIELLEIRNMRLGIIICVPYQHLVDQWVEDLLVFNFKPIIGYSSSPQKDWKKRLDIEFREYSIGVRDIFCFITTNATFATDNVQNLLKKGKRPMVLVVDEAHNFGTERLLNCLSNNARLFKYRLALSATFERHGDNKGTDLLTKYFENKCIEYTMEKAIKEGMLCKYYYYPIPVYLCKDELAEYNRLSTEIRKNIHKDKEGKIKLSEKVKMLLIKRSRIIAGARNKLQKLEEIMHDYVDSYYNLIYCGATKFYDEEGKIIDSSTEDLKQIDAVQRLINVNLKMSCLKFTSEETSDERRAIIDNFKTGNDCQVIVAIKCLDEGVNIPSIKTAFILASSTNPKEYIQRRGRVLRLSSGKSYAVIYDFITLPRDLDRIKATDDIDYDISLVRREVSRMKEFAKLSMRPSDTDILIDRLYDQYGMEIFEDTDNKMEDYFDE